MTPIRVLIPTTEGPVEVQRITPEDPQVRSVICLNGTSEALPVSPEYDAFVRKPTGIIQHRFGHPVFRLDLSGRIGGGRSWQLGVFIAHGLHHAGVLAGKEEAPQRVLWATGEVDRELLVRPVEHVRTKLESSIEVLRQWREQGVAAVVAIPAANLAEVGEGWLQEHGLEGHQLMAVTRADTLLHFLLPPEPSRHEGVLERQAREVASPSHALAITMTLLAVVLVGLGIFAWSNGIAQWRGMLEEGRFAPLRQAMEETENGPCAPCRWVQQGFLAHVAQGRPRPEHLEFSSLEWRAPWGGSCPATWRGMERTLQTERAVVSGVPFPPSDGGGLCGVRYRVGNPGLPVSARMLVFVQGKLAESGPGIVPPAVLATGAMLEQDYMIPGVVQRQGGDVEVVVLLSRYPLDGLYGDLLHRLQQSSWSSAQWEAFRGEVEPLGVSVFVARHGIVPRKVERGQEPTVLHYPATVPAEEPVKAVETVKTVEPVKVVEPPGAPPESQVEAPR